MGTKACDSLVIPLTSFNHGMLHRCGDEEFFLLNHRVDYLEMLYFIRDEIIANSPCHKIKTAISIHNAIERRKNGV